MSRRTKAQMLYDRMQERRREAVVALARLEEERGYLVQIINAWERWLVIDANRPESQP
jgi:hypothetical protein